MKKITILTLHLGYGGIERCISTLANSLVDDYEINIVSTYKLYDQPAFKLDDKIKVEYLIENDLAKQVEDYKLLFFKFKWIKLFKRLYKDYLKKLKFIQLFKDGYNGLMTYHIRKKKMIDYIKKCDSDIIISTRDFHNQWLGKYGNKNSLKIGWEHNYHNNDEKYINTLLKSVENLDYFVLVSNSLKEFYQTKTKTKCIYIPNALDEYPTKYSSLQHKNIISVGRLSYEKGYDDLIDVFKLVNEVYPDWKLDIVGDGAERKNIENKIKKYNLQDNIKLHGYQNREYINELLFKSSIYVMPSRTESFGIVLLEAFSYGLPVVAFDRATGAKELISDNWDGYLIKDSSKEQMAKRICELINNTNRRVIMGANALKKAEKYNSKNIKEEWLKIIK